METIQQMGALYIPSIQLSDSVIVQQSLQENEEVKVHVSDSNIRSFKDSVILLNEFIIYHGHYPNKRSEDQEEAKLGCFVMSTRTSLTNPKSTQPLSQSHQQLLFELIPDFIANDKDSHFTKQVVKLGLFIKDRTQYPSRNKASASEEEKQLAKFVQHLRSSYHKTDVSIDLTEQRIALINELIPDFVWEVDLVSTYQQQLKKLASYILTKGYPRMSGKNRDSDECQMGSLLHNTRQLTKKKITEYSQSKIDFINSLVADFKW